MDDPKTPREELDEAPADLELEHDSAERVRGGDGTSTMTQQQHDANAATIAKMK